MISQIFKNFAEFWHYTRYLSERQRDIIFHSLPVKQQTKLRRSFNTDGWEDLFLRNEIDHIVDSINKELKIDLISMRTRVLMGFSFYTKKSIWKYVQDVFANYGDIHTEYILGNLKSEKIDDKTVLIVQSDMDIE